MTTPTPTISHHEPDIETADRLKAVRHQLDLRYGTIGISAVAAALRYGSTATNPAYAHSPATARLDARMDQLSLA